MKLKENRENLNQKRLKMNSKIKELKSQFEIEKNELDQIIEQDKLKEDFIEVQRDEMAKVRHSNGDK